MRRRAVLGSVAVLVIGSGCLGDDEQACPDRDELELDEPISHDEHDVDVDVELDGGEGAELVTGADGAESVADDDSDAAEILGDVDFDAAVAVALTVGGNGSETEFTVLGVERESDAELAVYTCYERFNRDDVYVEYDRLLVVPVESEPPETVRLHTTTVGP